MRTKSVWLIAPLVGIVSAFAWQGLPNGIRDTAIQTGRGNVSIAEPKDRAIVPERPYVEGKVSDPNAEVWVIVHPMEVADYWVQQRLSVRQDGTWKVSIYIGRPGIVDVGKHFEIRAFANPKRPLKEGDVLKYWPDAESTSGLIEVIRK